MNKIILTIITLFLILTLVACGNDNKKPENTSNDTNVEEANKENSENKDKAISKTGEVSYEALMAMDPSPEKDFNVQKIKMVVKQ